MEVRLQQFLIGNLLSQAHPYWTLAIFSVTSEEARLCVNLTFRRGSSSTVGNCQITGGRLQRVIDLSGFIECFTPDELPN